MAATAPYLPGGLALSAALAATVVVADIYDGDLGRSARRGRRRARSDCRHRGALYAQPTEVVPGAIRGGERFSVDDPWVFVDLWSRLGIPYPVSSPPAVRVRFDPGWEAKLPYERSDF